MEKLDEIIFYTLEKSIKYYRKFAQNEISKKGFDITIDQWLVLKTLQANSELSQNQIADLVFKDIASVTRIIEILVKKNYLQRNINSNDRRKFELKITENGFQIIENIYPIIVKNRNTALKSISYEEINDLKMLLEKIIINCK